MTTPAEGEARRRLIETWRTREEAYGSDDMGIAYGVCADEREAALAPLSGPVCRHCKGSGNEPEAGFADSPCADCKGSGVALSGPVDAPTD